jgi:putative phosphoesterase
MRTLIFSDIHGNAVALDALLADVKGEAFDQMVCLGDAIQGGPQPAETVAQLRELGCPVVMGNADDWLLTGQASDAERSDEAREHKLNAVRHWSLAQLSDADQAFIHAFKATVEIPLTEGRKLLCYHGSPQSFDHVILPTTPEEEVRHFLEPDEQTIYTGGHTHMQFIRHLGRTFHFNPGSVGFAWRHGQDAAHFKADPFAEYAVLTYEPQRIRLEFRRVLLDVERLQQAYKTSGRPYTEEALAQYQG